MYKSVAQYGIYGDETQYQMEQYGMRLYNQSFENHRGTPRYHYVGLLIAATERDNAEQLKTVVDTEGDASIGSTTR